MFYLGLFVLSVSVGSVVAYFNGRHVDKEIEKIRSDTDSIVKDLKEV
jgi:hypothetical protein